MITSIVHFSPQDPFIFPNHVTCFPQVFIFDNSLTENSVAHMYMGVEHGKTMSYP